MLSNLLIIIIYICSLVIITERLVTNVVLLVFICAIISLYIYIIKLIILPIYILLLIIVGGLLVLLSIVVMFIPNKGDRVNFAHRLPILGATIVVCIAFNEPAVGGNHFELHSYLGTNIHIYSIIIIFIIIMLMLILGVVDLLISTSKGSFVKS